MLGWPDSSPPPGPPSLQLWHCGHLTVHVGHSRAGPAPTSSTSPPRPGAHPSEPLLMPFPLPRVPFPPVLSKQTLPASSLSSLGWQNLFQTFGGPCVYLLSTGRPGSSVPALRGDPPVSTAPHQGRSGLVSQEWQGVLWGWGQCQFWGTLEGSLWGSTPAHTPSRESSRARSVTRPQATRAGGDPSLASRGTPAQAHCAHLHPSALPSPPPLPELTICRYL